MTRLHTGNWSLRLGFAIILLLAIGSVAAAQESSENQSQEGAEEKPAAPKILAIDIGFASRAQSGHSQKLYQYSSPPMGLYLRELTLQPASMPYDGYGRLILRGYGTDDIRTDLALGFNGDATELAWSAARTRFVENTPLEVPDSSRRWEEFTLRRRVAPDFGITWHYATQNINRYMEAPREPERWRGRAWSLTAAGKAGDGSLGFTISDTRFYDRMLALPDTSIQTWRLNGVWAASPTNDISGSVAGTTFERSGSGVGRSSQVSLSGRSELGRWGDLTVTGTSERYRWPEMEGPYVQARRMVETGFATRLGTMGVRLRWQYREAERVRGDGSYLDVPKWTTVNGRLSGRLTRSIRLTIRGSSERMWQRPEMVTVDTRSAAWDGRDAFSVKLDASGDVFSGYASWSFQRRGNSLRGTNVTGGIAAAGATWNPMPRLELYGEISYETWRGRNPEAVYPTLGTFMPDSRTTSLGLSYLLGPRTFLWGGYVDTTTNNDNPLLLRDGNTRSNYFTLALRHRFAGGEEVALSVAPWTYRDKVDQNMNMTATTIVLSGRGRF